MNSWIIIGALLAMISGACCYYYNTTQATIQRLTENNVILQENNKTLETANQQNVDTIKDLKVSFDKVSDDYAQLQTDFQKIRSQNIELRERLGKHELDVLASAKPGLVENVINKTSEKAIRCLELLSGSTLTEREKNASSAQSFNSECPWLFDLISR